MTVKYIGKLYRQCESCSKSSPHNYEWKLLMKDLYPKEFKTELIICESCAKREHGSKNRYKWKDLINDLENNNETKTN